MSESREIAVAGASRPPASTQAVSVWSSPASFEAAQRMARALVESALVPEAYRNNVGNALIALDIAQRIDASPLMVMQNLHIIEGRPAWGASFIIGALNACGRFSPIRFRIEDRGEVDAAYDKWVGPKGERRKETHRIKVRDKACVAHCVERGSGEKLEGAEVSISMAVAEGWYTKPGSKWVTMPDHMLRLRSAAFFGRIYAPDLLMGMRSEDERHDIDDVEYTVVEPARAATGSAEPEKPADKPKRRPRGVDAAMKAEGQTPAAPAATPTQQTQTDVQESGSGDPGEGNGGGDEEDVGPDVI